MRATLHDSALASYAGRFVWLEVNVDDPRNAAFLAEHQASGYPMLYVIEPERGRAVRTWSGGASVKQVRELLDSVIAPPRKDDQAQGAFLRADRLLGQNDAPGAVAGYKEALKLGGPGWDRRGVAVEQLFLALQLVGDNAACTSAADEMAPGLPREHAFVAVAEIGLGCSLGAPPSEAEARLRALATEALTLPSVAEDERYQIDEELFASFIKAGDTAAAHALAERYLADIDGQPPPTSDQQRMARDLARVRAATKLGVPDRVIPVLEATEGDLHDVESASRLASAYLAAARFDDAIAAAGRGLGRHPGPEGTVRLLLVRAGAAARKGDRAAAGRDLDSALVSAARIPSSNSRDIMTGRIQAQKDSLTR